MFFQLVAGCPYNVCFSCTSTTWHTYHLLHDIIITQIWVFWLEKLENRDVYFKEREKIFLFFFYFQLKRDKRAILLFSFLKNQQIQLFNNFHFKALLSILITMCFITTKHSWANLGLLFHLLILIINNFNYNWYLINLLFIKLFNNRLVINQLLKIKYLLKDFRRDWHIIISHSLLFWYAKNIAF